VKVKSKVWLEEEGGLVFGSGKSVILKHIRETGSIAKAAKRLNMSYRHAWSYIKSAEKRLGKPLVQCTRGGDGGGGAVLTDYAEGLLKKFIKLEKKVRLFTDEQYKKTF